MQLKEKSEHSGKHASVLTLSELQTANSNFAYVYNTIKLVSETAENLFIFLSNK